MKNWGESKCIDLCEMASIVLNDVGEKTFQKSPDVKIDFLYNEITKIEEGDLNPFSAEVLRTYDSYKSKAKQINSWVISKLKSYKELKKYFNQHQILFIRDFALLADASSRKSLKESRQFYKGDQTEESVITFIDRYKVLYEAAPGTNTGSWVPDEVFIKRLNPEGDYWETRKQLQDIADALREHKLNKINQNPDLIHDFVEFISDAYTHNFPRFPFKGELSPKEQVEKTTKALEKVLARKMPELLQNTSDLDEVRCIYKYNSQDMSQRKIANVCSEICNKNVSQTQVSRVLSRTKDILNEAVKELLKDPFYKNFSKDVSKTEKLKELCKERLMKKLPNEEFSIFENWLNTYGEV